VEQSKCIQEPQHHAYDHDRIQDGLDAACHGDEAIHEPQEDTNYDQDLQNLKKGHQDFLSVFAARHFHAGQRISALSGRKRERDEPEMQAKVWPGMDMADQPR
jgi:hypothetical protein